MELFETIEERWLGFLPNLLGWGWLSRWRCWIDWRFDISFFPGFQCCSGRSYKKNVEVEDDLSYSYSYLLGFSEKVRSFEVRQLVTQFFIYPEIGCFL